VATDPADCKGSLRLVTETLAVTGTVPTTLAGIGLAVAGIVEPATGRLGRSPNLPGWENSDVGAAARSVFGAVPLAFANDVNAALYGEAACGAGRGCGDLVMIALGTGVGGGVMVGGRLVVGVDYGAGEIGHMVLDPQGPRCACGGHGCLEAWAGSVALLAAARRAAGGGAAELQRALDRAGRGFSTRDLADLALGGDAASRAIFNEAGRRLGQAVGNLINVLNPARVIIGGGVAQAGDLILEPCREMAPSLVLAAEARRTPIVMAELGPLAAAVGAASLARDVGLSG
jgi:glucokinase